MDLLSCFTYLNQQIFAIPATLLFIGVAIILTVQTRFIQIRGFPRFLHLITHGVVQEHTSKSRISPIRAVFAAMTTTMGMGNLVGPTIAIMVGGPGALFWLIVYIVLGSATKLAEVIFALRTRVVTDGHTVGGPMYYLREVHPFLAYWYAGVMVVLFAGWSSIQSNTLACICALEGILPWMVGASLALIVLAVLSGGVRRVGAVATTLVPFIFVLYVLFALIILVQNAGQLGRVLQEIFWAVLQPRAPIGAFVGVTLMQAMRAGFYQAIFITEAGVGTSSIPHAVADVKNPMDQGLLALFSTLANTILCTISGLLVLVTDIWLTGSFRSTLIYEVFKYHAPAGGNFVLLAIMILFVVSTVIGNSFNGVQTFGSLTHYRAVPLYLLATAACIFAGSLVQARLAWEIMETLLTLVAIPNLIGILILSWRHKQYLRF